MAPPPFPSTPTLQGNDSVSTASPGTWRHPQLKEIVRRQNASTFGDRNVKKIALNGGCLITSGFLGTSFRQCYQWLGSMLNIPTYPDLVLLAIRLLLLLNIVVALYPLYRPKDDLSDIPLTPSQRSLLGLDPSHSAPATPGTKYVTPPRYRLSSGSRTASPISPSSSPLSGRSGSQSTGKSQDGFPYSPSPSPLFHKAMGNGTKEVQRRQSFGSPSPLGRSSFRERSVFRVPSTPSPSGKGNGNGNGKSTNTVLTNKWLYEKTRSMSPNSSVYRS
ncbi:conserved hypothetical protein [Histoplasma capsulatum G186AR]|uniref:Nuclear pore complex component n=2 Tax=Ajellomyces capsulatus TaxID=5037 RepID=C0NTS6_AJECG|nr:uncharacterized protein HCBG_06556 [Histoplasma capsulatum G186AR]EEH05437.1 conserved hypothetical protein [Histoplasma capsulatum G186AR]KAG5305191.1 nuclear pore complex component [Histoplasma capsulatum]QSS76151.1 nuclear pore complex component [Histoplasma capsulatum G186AR]